MIKISILTDDVPAWANKMKSCLNPLRERKTPTGYYLENLMFAVDIEKELHSFRGKRYSHIIVDRYISKDFESCILRPCVSNPVIYEDGYFKDLAKRAKIQQERSFENETI